MTSFSGSTFPFQCRPTCKCMRTFASVALTVNHHTALHMAQMLPVLPVGQTYTLRPFCASGAENRGGEAQTGIPCLDEAMHTPDQRADGSWGVGPYHNNIIAHGRGLQPPAEYCFERKTVRPIYPLQPAHNCASAFLDHQNTAVQKGNRQTGPPLFLAKLLHCARTACALRAQRPGTHPRIPIT